MIGNLINSLQFNNNGIVVIDNFLSNNTCNLLRKFALYPPFGYQDFYPEYKAVNFDPLSDGIDQIKVVDEFKSKIKFLGDIQYTRSWCFCYDNKSRGVGPHADPSYININIWVTPNHCINDSKKNGLKIYHKLRDENVPHSLYNGNIAYISKQINDQKFTIVPYKYRRATIFLGSMYHQTMGVDMKDGHDNKRVSYTYLFNKG